MSELALDPPDKTSDEAGPPLKDEDYLILSTIHSAKGQEWRSVFVLNCVDGCIPSDLATGSSEEIEEERRLFYVGVTRARESLELARMARDPMAQHAAVSALAAAYDEGGDSASALPFHLEALELSRIRLHRHRVVGQQGHVAALEHPHGVLARAGRAAPGAARTEPEDGQHHQRPDQVELLLNGQRPGVLQR